jgi:hypothetical protein
MNRDDALAAWQALSDREKDAAVAGEVVGWDVRTASQVEKVHFWPAGDGGFYVDKGEKYVIHSDGTKLGVPPYTIDHAAAYAVEERIKEMGLRREYVASLLEVAATWEAADGYLWADREWELLHASPDQRACAAWVTVKVREGEK